MAPTIKLDGTIERKFDHIFVIRAANGYRYVAYRTALDSFGPKFEEIKAGMAVTFVPAEDARRNHDNRAVEVRVTNTEILDGI